MIHLSGKQLIAGQWQWGSAGQFTSYNPALGRNIEPLMSYACSEQIETALMLAEQAFSTFSTTSLDERAAFLIACANEVEQLGDELVDRAMSETGYSKERILTEKNRIMYQLRLFADVVKAGDFLDARINTALPQRKPTARPDLRFVNQSLGPVVVFGASNFPLAYSVLGGDTVSALAAGCPVIVKGHNSHAGTSEMIANALNKAIHKCNFPQGTFSLLFGEGNDIGEQLVSSNYVKAVGFTGSTIGGKALMAVAEKRKEPIPVFAEMGSINPVILLPETLKKHTENIAQQFIRSLTAGTGQFCVNPGLVIAIDSPALNNFIDVSALYLATFPAGVMLNQGIFNSYQAFIDAMNKRDGISVIALGQTPVESDINNKESLGCFTQATLLKTDAKTFISSETLKEEAFGHASLLVTCENEQELLAVIKSLPGQLSGTIQADEDELAQHPELIESLLQKVGRLVVNNFPTGVEVCESMMHGGPFPASSDVRFTSVGTASIQRFIRPICLQNYPKSLLPDSLKDNNPLNINRLIDGKYSRNAV